jgi:hypothetical protein
LYVSDRTSLTYLALADMVDIDTLPAYREGIDQYLKWPIKTEGTTMSRALNHIYLAEQAATNFDKKQLPSGEPKLVPSRFTSYLENEERLESFAQAWVLGMIENHTVVDGPNTIGRVRRVVISPREGEVDPYGRPVIEPHVWWLNDPKDYKGREVPFIQAVETFCLRTGAQPPEHKSIEDMHKRLIEAINLKLELLLNEEYLPKWQNGEGIALGVKAANMPTGKLREARLYSALRVSLYRDLVQEFELYLTKQIELRDKDQSTTLEDEITFMELMLDKLAIWIKDQSL